MWVCPVCGEQNTESLLCAKCGFDESLNYKKYRTLMETTAGGEAAVWKSEKTHEGKDSNEQLKRMALVLLAVAACITVLLKLVVIPEWKYQFALKSMGRENYVSAYHSFKELEDYRDSLEKLEEIRDAAYEQSLAQAKVGSLVLYGTYEQDNDSSNGKEDIEWMVLEKKDGKALLISEYCLECRPFDENGEGRSVTWEECSLRKWLNETFFKEAFSEAEQEGICETTLTNLEDAFRDEKGNDTVDKVFILSIEEAEQYFSSDKERRASPTDYAKAQGAETANGRAWWCLRELSKPDYGASFVRYDGDIYATGDGISDENVAVRPAIWIDLADSGNMEPDEKDKGQESGS